MEAGRAGGHRPRASARRCARARVSIEQQRLDYEAAEKQRAAEEEARELEKLKAQARAEVKALEVQIQQGTAEVRCAGRRSGGTGRSRTRRSAGTLQQVDCLGTQARLTVRTAAGATLKLLVANPGQISITGGGEHALGCGAQKARRVTIEYWAKSNARLGTTGEVATIEFQ